MRYMHVIAASALILPAAAMAQISGGTTGGMAGQTGTMGQTKPARSPQRGSRGRPLRSHACNALILSCFILVMVNEAEERPFL